MSGQACRGCPDAHPDATDHGDAALRGGEARKYLSAEERDAFLAAADRADRSVQTLCMTLAYSGCRLSEALALTVDRVDLAAGTVVFERAFEASDMGPL